MPDQAVFFARNDAFWLGAMKNTRIERVSKGDAVNASDLVEFQARAACGQVTHSRAELVVVVGVDGCVQLGVALDVSAVT